MSSLKKKKSGKKNKLRGICYVRCSKSKNASKFCPEEAAILTAPLCSRCCLLIGNSVSNKTFQLLMPVKCFHAASK